MDVCIYGYFEVICSGSTKTGKNGDNLCWTVGAGIILATAFLLPASIGIKYFFGGVEGLKIERFGSKL